MILLKNFFVNTTDETDVISIIHEVNRAIRESQLGEGTVNIVVPSPGAGLTIIEPLPDIIEYLKNATGLFPGEGIETKNRRKEEIAIGPRVAAAMLGKSITVPFNAVRLVLDPREEIVLVDFETLGQRREFVVQVVGETAQGGTQPKAQPARKR